MEVSLSVNGELAEAVAEVLARFAPNGIVSEQGIRHLNEEDDGTADGPITVRAYLPADATLARTKTEIQEALHWLGMIEPIPAPAFRPVADQNWMEAWKEHYRPIPIGKRLQVVPAWMEVPSPGRISIKINPGMAFGTGTHPSTQLCLGLLESALDRFGRDRSRSADGAASFIDVGCGSGILSIAALKLGASQALGVDIDPQSIENARENATVNGIGRNLQLGVGSLDEIRQGKFPIRSAQVVAANILAPTIVRLLDAGLAEIVAPGGTLIVGGILAEQGAAVIGAARARGLVQLESVSSGDWIALSLLRS
jgi:ribosomal protein L11 methyltransferase